MLIGNTQSQETSAAAVPADKVRVSAAQSPFATQVSKLSVLVDTANASGVVRVRGVIYDGATNNLIAEGDEVLVPPGLVQSWLDLPFTVSFPDGVPIPDTLAVRIGVHTGDDGLNVYETVDDAGGTASYYGVSTYGSGTYGVTGDGQQANDEYDDGAASALTSGTLENAMAVFATAFDLWVPSGPTTPEILYGRLPWPESQDVFSSTGPQSATTKTATLGWHGTRLDPERGAFCIAAAGGRFDANLGDRLLLETKSAGVHREAYVFVHNLLDGLATDLSVPRRPWAELDFLGLDLLSVNVTVMA